MTEEEVSMILNTFMYLDYKEANDGMKLKEILADLAEMPDCREGGLHYGEYQVLSKAAEDPAIGELVIDNQSHLMGYDSGTAACTFTEEGGSTYVVYRGTGDGEWPDNGLGMTEKSTIQQERALDYFEAVVEREQLTPEERLIITGHSKGGNKAQYVTMSTKYEELLDACYNIDGQGFSEKAIKNWQEIWGLEGYEERIAKMTGIYGENDYVNVLGHSIIREENVLYVRTPIEKNNFAGYHDIKYMFASMEEDPVTGEVIYIFHGEKNDYVAERGELARWAAELSESMMKLPPAERARCAAFMMQLLELGGDKKSGLNGERLGWTDIETFIKTGIPMIGKSLFTTGSGKDFLQKACLEASMAKEMKGSLCFWVDDTRMQNKAQELLQFADEIEQLQRKLTDTEKQMALFMKSSWILKLRLSCKEEQLKKESRTIKKMAEMLTEAAALYRSRDEEIANELKVCFDSFF